MLETVAQEFLTVSETIQNSEPNVSKTKRGFAFGDIIFVFCFCCY